MIKSDRSRGRPGVGGSARHSGKGASEGALGAPNMLKSRPAYLPSIKTPRKLATGDPYAERVP